MYFITGNKHKFEEVKSIVGNIEQMDIDLPEIQDIDARNIIRAKLLEAYKHTNGACIAEDTSLYFDCLNGLPGPLIKWFIKSIGNDGLVNLVATLGNNKATAQTIIGYAKNQNEVEFFEGTVTGTIVPPRGIAGFGWDSIFEPDGHNKTFAEMTAEEKNTVSMRKIAAEKLKAFLYNYSS